VSLVYSVLAPLIAGVAVNSAFVSDACRDASDRSSEGKEDDEENKDPPSVGFLFVDRVLSISSLC
jgi:hypothetical protein